MNMTHDNLNIASTAAKYYINKDMPEIKLIGTSIVDVMVFAIRARQLGYKKKITLMSSNHIARWFFTIYINGEFDDKELLELYDEKVIEISNKIKSNRFLPYYKNKYWNAESIPMSDINMFVLDTYILFYVYQLNITFLSDEYFDDCTNRVENLSKRVRKDIVKDEKVPTYIYGRMEIIDNNIIRQWFKYLIVPRYMLETTVIDMGAWDRTNTIVLLSAFSKVGISTVTITLKRAAEDNYESPSIGMIRTILSGENNHVISLFSGTVLLDKHISFLESVANQFYYDLHAIIQNRIVSFINITNPPN